MVFESEHIRLPVFLKDWLIVVYVESFIFFLKSSDRDKCVFHVLKITKLFQNAHSTPLRTNNANELFLVLYGNIQQQ